MAAELFHADVGTDMTKLIVAFRKFANASKRYESLFLIKGPILEE